MINWLRRLARFVFLCLVAFVLYILFVPTLAAQHSYPAGHIAGLIYAPPPGGAITQHVTPHELALIAKWEDSDLLLGRKTTSTLHYPPSGRPWRHARGCDRRATCLNGATFGFGFNLGAFSTEEATEILSQVMPAERAAQLADTFAGKTGTSALEAVIAANPTPQLDLQPSLALLRYMAQYHKDRMLRRAAREGLVRMVNGRDVLGRLNAGQFAVLVALDYSCASCGYEATNIWRQLKQRQFEQAENNIRYYMGSRRISALQTRRHWEANYFRRATALLERG